MRPSSVRVLAATALAAAAIAISSATVGAASGFAGCTLVATEGDAPEQLATIFESAAITGPDDVWAVGSHVVGGVSTAYAERWDGAAWTVQELDLPAGPTSISSLYGVTAFGPDDVWAVGSWLGDDPLIQHWDGTRWSAEDAPEIVGTERILTAVAGTGPDDLWAVGQRRVDGQEHGIVLHRTATGWEVVAPPASAVLHGVATLPDGRPLVAGWSIDDGGWAHAVIASRAATGAWTPEVVPAAPGRNVFLTGLALATPGAAWAVGFTNDSPNGDLPVTLQRHDGGWREVPVLPQDGSTRLLGVATGPAGTVAVGEVASAGQPRALALETTAGGWTPIAGASDAPPDALSGVAIDGTDVWAVGRRVVTGATYGIPAARVYSCGA